MFCENGSMHCQLLSSVFGVPLFLWPTTIKETQRTHSQTLGLALPCIFVFTTIAFLCCTILILNTQGSTSACYYMKEMSQSLDSVICKRTQNWRRRCWRCARQNWEGNNWHSSSTHTCFLKMVVHTASLCRVWREWTFHSFRQWRVDSDGYWMTQAMKQGQRLFTVMVLNYETRTNILDSDGTEQHRLCNKDKYYLQW